MLDKRSDAKDKLFSSAVSVTSIPKSPFLTPVDLIKSLIRVSKKAIYTITNDKVSDHWKENIIPKYSIQMMKYSMQMLLILFLIIFIFVIADNFFRGFLAFTFSWNGIIESILLAFSYAYIRKLIFR